MRAHAYLEVAPFIAQFDEYKEPLSRHLIEVRRALLLSFYFLETRCRHFKWVFSTIRFGFGCLLVSWVMLTPLGIYMNLDDETLLWPACTWIIPPTHKKVKLRHWDPSVRSLAARALAALVPSNPQYFAGDALDVLLPWTIDPVLEVGCLVLVFFCLSLFIVIILSLSLFCFFYFYTDWILPWMRGTFFL